MRYQSIEQQIHDQLKQMPIGKQRQVRDFAQDLGTALSQGIPGQSLLKFSGLIEAEDLSRIENVIEEDCEKINPNEW